MFALSTADISITFRILSYAIAKFNHPGVEKQASSLLKYKTTLFVASK